MSNEKGPPPYEEYATFSPIEVKVGNNLEFSLREFKSLVQKEKVLSLYKEKQAFEKPSEKKRRKRLETEEKLRMLEMREKMMASGEWDRRQKEKEKAMRAKADRKRKEARDALDL